MKEYSEDSPVEQPTLQLFHNLGWEIANCLYEKFGANGTLGREPIKEGFFLRRARDLLLPKLISGEVDVENTDVQMPNNGGA